MPEPIITALVDDAIARIESLEAPKPQVKPEPQAPAVTSSPYWGCVLFTGITLTTGAGEDWAELVRRNRASATAWIEFDWPTATGAFECGDEDGSGVASSHRLFRICWLATNPEKVSVVIRQGHNASTAGGTLQYRMNGVVTETSIGFTATLNVRPGINELVIVCRDTPDSVQLLGRLFEPSTWRPARAIQY